MTCCSQGCCVTCHGCCVTCYLLLLVLLCDMLFVVVRVVV